MKSREMSLVAAYIDEQIALSGIPQKDIASALGYDNPNVVTMLRQGKMKLPINKVGPFAKVLEVDPVYLLRLALAEYMPDTFESIQSLLGRSLITQNELSLIQIVRETTLHVDFSISNASDRKAFTTAVDDIALTQFMRKLKMKV